MPGVLWALRKGQLKLKKKKNPGKIRTGLGMLVTSTLV